MREKARSAQIRVEQPKLEKITKTLEMATVKRALTGVNAIIIYSVFRIKKPSSSSQHDFFQSNTSARQTQEMKLSYTV